MAAIIFTVGMAVARRTALVAVRDNLIRYTFAHPLVKNKIFANKTHRQALLARLTGVFNNSALDMPDFVESVMFHPGTGLFTTNAAGAVHDDFFIFMCLHHLNCFWQPDSGGMNKAERLEYGQSLMTHAMVFQGVNLDENGKPNRWRVENSWGEDACKDGYYVMTDEWFNEYTYQIVVNKKYLSQEILDIYASEPTMLEPWDPMGSLAE